MTATLNDVAKKRDTDASAQQPIGWVSLACGPQRDWARTDTVAEVVDIVLTARLLNGI